MEAGGHEVLGIVKFKGGGASLFRWGHSLLKYRWEPEWVGLMYGQVVTVLLLILILTSRKLMELLSTIS